MMNLRQALIGAASLIALTVPAVAAETVKIAYIDPLSGGGATIGENGLKHYQYPGRGPEREGRHAGHKFEVVGYDNKGNPQESLVAGAEGDRRRASASSRRATAPRSPPRWSISSPSTTSAIPARKSSTSTTPRSIRC